MNNYRSEQLNELFTALAKAQNEMETAGKNQSNPFYKSKYADLLALIEASRPYLSKNGLSVIQRIEPWQDGIHQIITVLGHASGQWMESVIRITPEKPGMQAFAANLSYLARHAYARIICIGVGDDDGENEREFINKQTTPKTTQIEKISDEQAQQIIILRSKNEPANQYLINFCKVNNIERISDIPKSRFNELIRQMEIK